MSDAQMAEARLDETNARNRTRHNPTRHTPVVRGPASMSHDEPRHVTARRGRMAEEGAGGARASLASRVHHLGRPRATRSARASRGTTARVLAGRSPPPSTSDSWGTRQNSSVADDIPAAPPARALRESGRTTPRARATANTAGQFFAAENGGDGGQAGVAFDGPDLAEVLHQRQMATSMGHSPAATQQSPQVLRHA